MPGEGTVMSQTVAEVIVETLMLFLMFLSPVRGRG